MEIFLLSCDKIENGGGIYKYSKENDIFVKRKYYPCDRPMYAKKCKHGLCVLLRKPFEDSIESGYFYIDQNLQKPTEVVLTKGVVACHLDIVNDDVYVVNYLSGNIVKNGMTKVQREGSSINRTRQTEPHTHFIENTLDNRLVVCDLGTDTLAVYTHNLDLVSEAKVPQGYGIRHLVFSKDKKYIYAINELVPSISVFIYDNGYVKYISTTEINCENKNASGAAIRLSENGEKLFVSVREENVICVYDVRNEKLTLSDKVNCGGDSPRDFQLFDKILICCNEKSDNAVFFEICNGKIKKQSEIRCNKVLCCL